METDVYRLISHPLQDPSTLRGGLAIHKKIAGKCRRPFSDPPGDLIDRWEHRDGRGRAPRANGSDIPFSAKRPISRGGKGVNCYLVKTDYCQIDISVTLSVEVPTPRPCCQGVRQVETPKGGVIFKSLFDFLNVQKLTFFLHGRGAGRRWLTRHKLRRQTPLTVP